MSAPVKLPAIFSGIKSRKDRSYRLEFDTRELGTDAAQLFKLHGSECWVLIAPDDSLEAVDVPEYKPDTGVKEKTPASRLRSVLFVLWKQLGEPGGDFDRYYRERLERIIDQYKAKLDGEEVI